MAAAGVPTAEAAVCSTFTKFKISTSLWSSTTGALSSAAATTGSWSGEASTTGSTPGPSSSSSPRGPGRRAGRLDDAPAGPPGASGRGGYSLRRASTGSSRAALAAGASPARTVIRTDSDE